MSSPKNIGIVGPSPEFDAHSAEMRQKLADPDLRAQVRIQETAQIDSLNPDLVQVLGLNAAEGGALLDLLTEQQMRHLDRFYVDRSAPQSAADVSALMQQHSTADLNNKQQIKDLIGQTRFDLYLSYLDALPERQHAVYFDGKLDASNKLTADQKHHLMQLLRTQIRQSLQKRRLAASHIPAQRRSGSEDIQATMRQQKADMTERSFLQMVEDSRLVLAQLPEILTPRQIAVFVSMEDEKLAAQRVYVQHARLEAGMSPDFDE